MAQSDGTEQAARDEFAGQTCLVTGAAGMTTQLSAALRALIPLGRMGTANEVAHAILYLASPRAGFVTDEVLDVNGGLTVG